MPGVRRWVISDPSRSKRPNVGHKKESVCPFCLGYEQKQGEVYRVGGEKYDSNWRVRVIRNIYPFASVHEIIIHSPDHHKNFEELPLKHIEEILRTYKGRYKEHSGKGRVCIFHNRGIAAGESLPHPHTQLAVVPGDVDIDAPPLDIGIKKIESRSKDSEKGGGFSFFGLFGDNKNEDEQDNGIERIETKSFYVFCPESSQWPDEVWVAPKRGDRHFGDINDEEIEDLAFCLQRLISIFDIRYGHEFPFNFYIYPGSDWYLRIVPRIKVPGGFELSTGIIVNTQSPKETFEFVKDHFDKPDFYKIHIGQQADYWESV